ncbi:hypothetical protein J6590_104622 [Homalodisca vitripennis]|nr:hypothetical protein J6590_104622 [Homalodisca vitripennis]
MIGTEEPLTSTSTLLLLLLPVMATIATEMLTQMMYANNIQRNRRTTNINIDVTAAAAASHGYYSHSDVDSDDVRKQHTEEQKNH